MRGTRAALAGIMVAVAALVATACYPPSQTPYGQEIPPGGRVVATLPALTFTDIVDVSDDLSTIVYSTYPFELTTEPLPTTYWVHDDEAGTTTRLPLPGDTSVQGLSPDEGSVLFTSANPTLQVGPVSPKCVQVVPWQPTRIIYCSELYLYDLGTGQTTQLTGLDGSSEQHHQMASFAEDGTAVFFTTADGAWAPTFSHYRMDLATGVIEVATLPARDCCSWDRGTHVAVWDEATWTLTFQDALTGEVTTKFTDTEIWGLRDVIQDGRYLIVSRWVGQNEIFKLLDLDTGAERNIASRWISADMSRFAVVQQNVAPDGTDRLIIAPFPN